MSAPFIPLAATEVEPATWKMGSALPNPFAATPWVKISATEYGYFPDLAAIDAEWAQMTDAARAAYRARVADAAARRSAMAAQEQELAALTAAVQAQEAEKASRLNHGQQISTVENSASAKSGVPITPAAAEPEPTPAPQSGIMPADWRQRFMAAQVEAEPARPHAKPLCHWQPMTDTGLTNGRGQHLLMCKQLDTTKKPARLCRRVVAIADDHYQRAYHGKVDDHAQTETVPQPR